MRRPDRRHRPEAPSNGTGGDTAWRAAVGLVLAVALEALDPPLLVAAIGAPLLAGLAPSSIPRPLRVALDAIADASPLQSLLQRP